MTLDDAVVLVTKSTGWYPISAFSYDGTIYVSITPLTKYDPEDVVGACFIPVKNGVVGEPLGFGDVFMDPDMPDAFFEAMNNAKSYLKGRGSE